MEPDLCCIRNVSVCVSPGRYNRAPARTCEQVLDPGRLATRPWLRMQLGPARTARRPGSESRHQQIQGGHQGNPCRGEKRRRPSGTQSCCEGHCQGCCGTQGGPAPCRGGTRSGARTASGLAGTRANNPAFFPIGSIDRTIHGTDGSFNSCQSQLSTHHAHDRASAAHLHGCQKRPQAGEQLESQVRR